MTTDGDNRVMTSHNEMVARVLQRHGIAQVQLADEAGCSESTITRIIQCKRPLTPEVTAALWKLTFDSEIISVLTGDFDIKVIRKPSLVLNLEQAELEAVHACGSVLAGSQLVADDENAIAVRTASIDRAIDSLLALRSNLAVCHATKSESRTVRHACVCRRSGATA